MNTCSNLAALTTNEVGRKFYTPHDTAVKVKKVSSNN